ncbi:MAG: hypothetical protein ACOH1Y_16050 [Propionicimonas sp.]
MSSVVTRNTRMVDEPPAPPYKDDGTMFLYSMFFDGDKFIAYADEPADLLESLIPGYNEMDEQSQVQARIMLAVTVQTQAQAYINADPENAEKIAALTDKEHDALTSPRHTQPHGWGPDPQMGDFWDSEVPLVLVETGYAPYTTLDRPMSSIAHVVDPPNMIWLRPQDEWEFLLSLHRVGSIRMHQASDL